LFAQVKELERRLAGVIITAFDDGCTLETRFQLLDSFEGLLDQPTVRAALQKKHAQMLASYAAEVREVTEIFHSRKQTPNIDSNMPPVAGAMQWARILANRLGGAEKQIKKLAEGSSSPAMLESCREVEKMCNAIQAQLGEYERQQVAEWDADVNLTSDEKLNMSLLRRDEATRRLSVNFDQALVRLLREVKYALLLNIVVQERALSIYQRAEIYRTNIGNLEWIVSMYNEMIDTLDPVERPLFEQDIIRIDQTIERGLYQLNWKSPEVEAFINESLEIVKFVFKNVRLMKDHLEQVKKQVSDFAKTPLIDRKTKPVFPSDFEDTLKSIWKSRGAILYEIHLAATKLFLETQTALKVFRFLLSRSLNVLV
jgi:dynein heavy chain, axonemal